MASSSLSSGSVSFTATDFNFQTPVSGTSAPLTVTAFDNDGISAAIDGYNNQVPTNLDFSGAALAQFNVTDGANTASITLTSTFADMTALAAELQTQVRIGGGNLATSTVTYDAGTGGLLFSNVGQTAALQVTNVDANGTASGFVASAGVAGAAANPAAAFDVDNVTITMATDSVDITGFAAELTTLMQASALGAGYSAAVVSGKVVITNANAIDPVDIANSNAKALASGITDVLGVTGAVASAPSTLTIDGNVVNLSQDYLSFDNMGAAIQAQLGVGFAVTNTAGAFTITRVDAGGAASAAINITGDAASDTAGITTAGVATGIPGTDFTATTIANFTVGTANVRLNQAYADRTAVRDALQAQLAGYVVTDNGSSYTFTSLTSPAPVAISNADAGAIAAGFIDSPGTAGQANANQGDKFTLALNTNATGDNRNALLMTGMQNQNIMANGSATFQGIYGQLVGEGGAKTHELFVTSQAQINMTAQTVAAQQSVSGVNLDEEAANLMRYQRAYQAAAKAMQVANTMFDALLAIGG